MQPQNNPTGYSQPTPQASGLPPVPQPPQAPGPMYQSAPTAGVHAAPVMGTPAPSGHTGAPESADHWTEEVKAVLDQSAYSPKQQAEKLADIRNRYQQQVLGLKRGAQE